MKKEQKSIHWGFAGIVAFWMWLSYDWGTNLWPIGIPLIAFMMFNGIFGTKYFNPVHRWAYRLGFKSVNEVK